MKPQPVSFNDLLILAVREKFFNLITFNLTQFFALLMEIN